MPPCNRYATDPIPDIMTEMIVLVPTVLHGDNLNRVVNNGIRKTPPPIDVVPTRAPTPAPESIPSTLHLIGQPLFCL